MQEIYLTGTSTLRTPTVIWNLYKFLVPSCSWWVSHLQIMAGDSMISIVPCQTAPLVPVKQRHHLWQRARHSAPIRCVGAFPGAGNQGARSLASPAAARAHWLRGRTCPHLWEQTFFWARGFVLVPMLLHGVRNRDANTTTLTSGGHTLLCGRDFIRNYYSIYRTLHDGNFTLSISYIVVGLVTAK